MWRPIIEGLNTTPYAYTLSDDPNSLLFLTSLPEMRGFETYAILMSMLKEKNSPKQSGIQSSDNNLFDCSSNCSVLSWTF